MKIGVGKLLQIEQAFIVADDNVNDTYKKMKKLLAESNSTRKELQ